MNDASAAQDIAAVRDEAFDAPPAETVRELPGRFLREAREGLGLSVADVAATLKFGVRQIEALEADDFRNLQGATFVRGFVRSYARFLKLAPEPLLDMLKEGATVVRAEVRPPEDTGVYMPMPGQPRLSPWVAGAAALTLLAAGLAAWHLLAPDTAQPARQLAATDTPAAVASLQPEVLPPTLRVEPPSAAPSADGKTHAPAPPLPPDGRQLLFLFSDRSWLEVRDATQRVVLSGEFAGGERQVASGKPPYYLWVGRASALRVIDGEREIDLKPHTRDEVARLTVE